VAMSFTEGPSNVLGRVTRGRAPGCAVASGAAGPGCGAGAAGRSRSSRRALDGNPAVGADPPAGGRRGGRHSPTRGYNLLQALSAGDGRDEGASAEDRPGCRRPGRAF